MRRQCQQLDHGWRVLRLAIPIWRRLGHVVVTLTLAAGCGDVGQIGDGAVSVDLTNRCKDTAFAVAADSLDTVVARFRLRDEIPAGEWRGIGLVTNVAYSPEKFFLAYSTDPQAARPCGSSFWPILTTASSKQLSARIV
jgi:hypothetical protein